MSVAESSRVFVLGLDGATFDLLIPMIEQGRLPTFARLFREGAHAPLNSTILSHSAPAWTSFATGKNPGKHSISGFTQLQPNAYTLRLLKGSDNKARTIWDLLSAKNRNVIVINIPMTYPPRPVNGVLVSGLDAPGLQSNFTYPPEFREEIFRVSPNYRINLHLGGFLQSHKRRIEAIGVMLASIEARRRLVLHLMRNRPWDFFAVRFNSPDNVQHQFWRFMDKTHRYYDPNCPEELKNAIPTIYQKLDETAALVLEALPADATLVVMSDHGAGPRTNKTVRLNEWLAGREYLALATSKTAGGLGSKVRRLARPVMEAGLSTLLRFLPAEVKQGIMKRLPGAVSRTWTYFRFPDIDWSRTRAFVGEIEGIRINRQGEYPKGTVAGDAYEPLRDKIIAELRELRDPSTSEKIFQTVTKREEVFQGPYVKYLPDIIAICVKDQYNISSRVSRNWKRNAESGGLIQTEEHWRKISGSHRREGIFIARGPQVLAGVEKPHFEIVDVLPTVLYLLGLPIPSDVDGRVLTEILDPALVAKRPIQVEIAGPDEDRGGSGEIYSAEDAAKRIDDLRGLGYIE
jgi:predicted AlkP superfamily phosphohydrolase/phosphomutase